VNFHQLLHNLLEDTLAASLPAFASELIICATIIVLLCLRIILPKWETSAFYTMLIGTALALSYAAPWQYLKPDALSEPVSIFTGMLVFDTFSVYIRSLLLFFVLLFTVFTQTSGFPSRENSADFYVLVLGATLGMCLMASANHMLIVFLGLEMASVPSYVLTGMMKSRRESSEAALKYAVYGAGASGVMLYGISLLVGTLGSAHIPTMATQLASLLSGELGSDCTMVLVLGSLMTLVGLAFKLSAVPFHFWAPDVFEGASAEVAAFLSIASKAAALALLVRVAVGFSVVADLSGTASLEPVRHYICGVIAVMAAATCTFGNLAAYGQTNMKRLLAYSTIAHAGYMMMPVAAAIALVSIDLLSARQAIGSMAFYLATYLFMNLSAFACVALLRNRLNSEEIDSYSGLIRTSPGLTICFSIALLSLLGLPPLAGFVAKFAIFASVLESGLLALLAIGVLNSVLSLFYYIRVVKVMAMSNEAAEATAKTPLTSVAGSYILLVTAPIVVLGLWWNGLFNWASAAAASMLF